MTPSQSKSRAHCTSVARDITERRDTVDEALFHLPEIGGAHAVMQGAETKKTSVNAVRIILDRLASIAITVLCTYAA